jgi:hypothetical protein
MQRMRTVWLRKITPDNFINILLLIIFVPTDIFYLFYFGKEGCISKQRLILI